MRRCCFLFLPVSFEISETPKQLVQKRHQIANAINVTNILLLCRENIFCNNLLGPIFQELNHDTNQLLKIELNQKKLIFSLCTADKHMWQKKTTLQWPVLHASSPRLLWYSVFSS